MNEDEIRQLYESMGVKFVNRSWGPTSTKTITLDCLVKVVNKAIDKQIKQYHTDDLKSKPGKPAKKSDFEDDPGPHSTYGNF